MANLQALIDGLKDKGEDAKAGRVKDASEQYPGILETVQAEFPHWSTNLQQAASVVISLQLN